MKSNKYILLFFGLVFFFHSFAQDSEIQVFDFQAFEPMLTSDTDTTYIINFWASWCPPCLKEMPAFEEIRQKYKNEKLKILLVSFDFPKDIEKSMLPLIKKYKIGAEVIVLDEPDANSWINKVSPEWSGSIPATLVFNPKSRNFYERSFTFHELDSIVKLNLNQ
ncbi:MAG: TlpA family protein disulfide reductase [Bacteroidales bacterium]|nr:TlpA family protein disulfide reductase [Bacteroidales bacterium]